jgi:hypothetical protein
MTIFCAALVHIRICAVFIVAQDVFGIPAVLVASSTIISGAMALLVSARIQILAVASGVEALDISCFSLQHVTVRWDECVTSGNPITALGHVQVSTCPAITW